jgi:hypothetical protein
MEETMRIFNVWWPAIAVISLVVITQAAFGQQDATQKITTINVIVKQKYLNAKESKPFILDCAKRLLSYANIRTLSTSTVEIKPLLTIECTFEAKPSKSYQGLYCIANANGLIQLTTQDSVFKEMAFDNTCNAPFGTMILNYAGQYKTPDSAPFMEAFQGGFNGKMLLILYDLMGTKPIENALNSKNIYDKCGALYVVGERNLVDYIPRLIQILENNNWDGYYHNPNGDDIIYCTLEALRKITAGSFWDTSWTSYNHNSRRKAFFKWWESNKDNYIK